MSTGQPSANFRADIQGMRGIAVLLVVLYHAGLPVPGGFIGVDVFFVLSGFVITEGMLRGLESGKFSFAEFYRKRVRRLLPALALMTTVVLATAWFLGPIAGQLQTGRTGVAATLLNANHYLMRGNGYFDASTEYISLLHTWSLSVEEQFYLFFPLVTVVLWRAGRRLGQPKVLVAGLAVFSLLSLVLCVWLSYRGSVLGVSGLKFAFFSPITRSWEFGIGALLAVVSPWVRTQKLWVAKLGWVGLAMVLAASFLISPAMRFPGFSALIPAFGTGFLLLPGFFGSQSLLVRALSWRGLVRLGDLSYSWYLWHWPLIVFSAACFPQMPLPAMVCAAVGSLGVAWASERYWETPIRFRPKSRQWSVGLVGALCVAVPIAVFFVQDKAVSSLSRPERLERPPSNAFILEAYSELATYRALPCNSQQVWPNVSPACKGAGSSGKGGVLVGDSNARQVYPEFRDAAEAAHLNWGVATLSACPFADVALMNRGKVVTGCKSWNAQQMEALLDAAPELVVIAGAWDVYILEDANAFTDPSSGAVASGAEEKRAMLSRSLVRVVRRLVANGSAVVLVDVVPKATTYGVQEAASERLKKSGAFRCSLAALALNSERCELPLVRHLDAQWMEEIVQAVNSPSVFRLDMMDSLCHGGSCSFVDGAAQRIVYADEAHLSPSASARLSEVWRDVLVRMTQEPKMPRLAD